MDLDHYTIMLHTWANGGTHNARRDGGQVTPAHRTPVGRERKGRRRGRGERLAGVWLTSTLKLFS